MTDWQPATEAEVAMRDALQSGDQELYFRILARTEVLLPVSADALAGRAPMGWGTWTSGNRTHILSFTSEESLHTCLGEHGGSFRRLSFDELARQWPDYEWWLAVNPGLFIEAYLPSWFVSQLTRGDVRLPGRTMGARARMAQSEFAAAASNRTRGAGAVAGPGTPPPASAPAEQATGAAPDQGVGEARVINGELVLSPTDTPPERPAELSSDPLAGLLSPEVPARDSADLPPPAADPDTAPTPRPDPAGNGGRTRQLSIESRLAGAFRPMSAREPAAAQPAAPTSLPESTATPPGDVSTATPPEDASSGARQGQIPPGSAEADVPPENSAPAHGEQSGMERLDFGSPINGWAGSFVPANETERELLAAAESNSTEAFLSTLLLARILLSVPDGTPSSAHPTDKDFPWQPQEAEGQAHIAVFTSPERLAEHRRARGGTDTTAVSLKFVELIGAWPDEKLSFAVNPGSPVGATLPGSQVVALASWAREVGLGAASSGELTPVSGAGGTARSAARKEQSGSGQALIMMQKTIMPAQVPYYLDRGYDRASGFVHRVSEVSHLSTPHQLYHALGLGYSGSPFRDSDTEVFVLRWPAHRADLYRIPYGGQDEASMRAMQGWVIEQPPFRGNGFAPGDTGEIIAEFKVDSVRLPHGAQMWRLDKAGAQTLVATFDADGPRWLRQDSGAGESIPAGAGSGGGGGQDA